MYITNGLPRDRWHGQRYVRPSEGFAIWREALARLERINPELFKAVQELIDKEYEARQGLTYEEWKVAGHKSFVRISRLRRAIRRRRLEAQSGGQVY